MTAQPGLLWKHDAAFQEVPYLAVGRDGTTFLTYSRALLAVGGDGKQRWRVAGALLSPDDHYWEFTNAEAVVGPDDNLCVVTAMGHVQSYSPAGKQRWELPLDGPYSPQDFVIEGWRAAARPVVSKDGIIYVQAADKKVYALSSEGKILWRRGTVNRPGIAEPVLLGGRLIIVSAGAIVALATDDGRQLWSRPPELHDIVDRLSGDASTLVVVYSRLTDLGGRIHAFRVDGGQLLWSWTAEKGASIGEVLISPTGALYTAVYHHPEGASTYFHTVTALSKDGKLEFDAELPGSAAMKFSCFGPIAADAVIYGVFASNAGAPSPEGQLAAVSVADGKVQTVLRFTDFAGAACRTGLLPDGRLVLLRQATGYSIYLYAIQTRSAGLARGGWPKVGHDNQNSGDSSTPLF